MLSSQTGLSLEFPVMLHATGKTPVMGIIEALSTTECRLRSLVVFDRGASLNFELIVHGGAHAKLNGTVVDVQEALPRRHYQLRLAEMPQNERDALGLVIAELHARASGPRAVHAQGGALARASARAPVDFGVGYSIEHGAFGNGRAANISIGGMLMVTDGAIAVGSTLETTFSLEIGGKVKEIVTSARVVAHQRRPDGTWQNHIAFFNVDEKTREEIAAYVADAPVAS